MSYILFVDESGQDHRESPYEVLAGIAIEDRDVWNVSCALRDAELRHFGRAYGGEGHELKAKKLLTRKTFRLAGQLPAMPEDERRSLAKEALDHGADVTRRELTALAQSKIAYVEEALEICFRFRGHGFASIVEPKAPVPYPGQLREDYGHLLERFFYFLEDQGNRHSGIVVFDELDKSQSHILLGQMTTYFRNTDIGRERAGYILPEPFFVHSDLTTGIQLADFMAYIISWGVRLAGMTSRGRPELADLSQQVLHLRYDARRVSPDDSDRTVCGFAYLDDLRPDNA